MSRNHQKVLVDYFFNNDLKYLQREILTKTYTTSLTKTKAAQYDLLLKTWFQTFRVLLKSPMINMHFRVFLIGWINVSPSMDMHEACNPHMMYTLQETYSGQFKEGDFPRLHINDIEDMLLLVVQNRLTGDDVSDFTITLRMFTRSLVIQKRVEDLQLRVESYQKKINVTKPETTKSGIMKRGPSYTLISNLMDSLCRHKW
ncbi:hypothetical protein Tco_0339681 [Tanacetum coccineum]